jgi:phosphomannomutase
LKLISIEKPLCHFFLTHASTGVKYLHHEAKHFDIGIYFESNGHGTVLFKPSLLQRLQDMEEQV